MSLFPHLLSTRNIYTYQTIPYFLHPSATLVLELIDPFGLIDTVLNKISSSTKAYLLKVLHYSLH